MTEHRDGVAVPDNVMNSNRVDLPEEMSAGPPIESAPEKTAFFFDLDGTLADIVDHPANAVIRPELRKMLAVINKASDGALAIISGRELAVVDQLLKPLHLAVGGSHGAEWRRPGGSVETEIFDPEVIRRIDASLQTFAGNNPGVLVEPKRASVALHYRLRPELENRCEALAASIAQHEPVILLRGKKVVELKAAESTKGDVIARFMSAKPFKSRRPIFVGDDVTDEDGFRALERWRGLSIRIGNGPTVAKYRLENIDAFQSWLREMIRAWKAPG